MTDTEEHVYSFASLFYTNVSYAGIDFDYVEVGRGQLTVKFTSLYFTISTEVRPVPNTYSQ
jgi:hypothetical protein